MSKKRRAFIKEATLSAIAFTGSGILKNIYAEPNNMFANSITEFSGNVEKKSVIGLYGPWAASLNDDSVPSHSFRNNSFIKIDQWRDIAKACVLDRMAIPPVKNLKISILKRYLYDGLQIEELTWELPYGRPTSAILMKPANAKGKLPGILAFHDHGGNKYFGTRKITKTSDNLHPSITAHQKEYYEGRAWANEIVKRGYIVLVNDAFPFASRRVLLEDVPEYLRHGLDDHDPERPENIAKYNEWAGQHEHIMAKSLFSAGTTWPGVFYAEDKIALDILCARDDVDSERIGCGGLSGGGMRTVFMGGLDPRIKCAVPVGFMTTWKDFLLNKSYQHTWMVYVPLLPRELDFPEILSLRAPLPALVLNNEQDDLYTMREMQKAEQILKEVYAKADAANNMVCNYYPGPHKFDRKMQEDAFAWFDKWLR